MANLFEGNNTCTIRRLEHVIAQSHKRAKSRNKSNTSTHSVKIDDSGMAQGGHDTDFRVQFSDVIVSK